MACKKINSIGISGVLTIAAHDLNNQGSEGNVTIERTASIVVNGEVVTVNAISGDMLKHSVAKYINAIAKEDKLPLCKGCMVDSSNRINMEDKSKLRKSGTGAEIPEEEAEDAEEGESPAKKSTKKKTKDKGKFTDAELSDRVIQLCAGDDLCGFMITENKTVGNMHRKSCFETGMVIGIPEKVQTERDFHVKFSKEDKVDGDGSNVGQNIFHRPNNSGDYATVMSIEVARIGVNDYTYNLAIPEEEQQKRLKVLLKAIASSYVNLLGAQRNTQMPHIIDFKGVITISHSGQPAPTISALNPKFTSEIQIIADNFNKLCKDAIEVKEFGSIGHFTDLIAELV